MRAIDTVEKLVRDDPSRAAPYVGLMLRDLTTSDQPSVQWHLAQLLALVDLTDEQTDRAVAWLVERIATTEVDWIVAAHAMDTLVELQQRGVVGADLVRPLLEVQTAHRSASVRRKAASVMEALAAGGVD